MKKALLLIMGVLCIIALNAKSLYVLNSGSHTLSLVNTETNSINNSFATVGLYSNQILEDNDGLWIVNSGDNNCKKYNKLTGALLKTIQLENSANPWNMVKYGDKYYISGLMSGKIYIYNSTTDQISDFQSGTGPEGLLVCSNKLYVANTGFQYPNYTQGKVAVFDLNNNNALITEINVETNPQALILGSDNNIHVVCSGNYTSATGKVCIINPETNALIQTIDTGLAPNNINELSNHKVYLADGNNAGFIVYDAISKEITNNSTNTYLPGASKIILDSNNKYVLKTGDWQGNSRVEVLNQSDIVINTLTVGVGAVDLLLTGTTGIEDNTVAITPSLIKAYPNPFNENVTIKSTNNRVNQIGIYNIKGEKIREYGSNSINWDGKNTKGMSCSSGIYFVICKANNQIVSKKAISLIK